MGTAGHRGAWAVLQGDGNLVVHARDGSVLKTTGTGGQTLGTYSLSIQENSNLVILNAAGANLWSSDTTSDTLGSTEALQPGQWLRSPSQRYKLWMQTDGDLVLYRVWNHTIAWQTDTRVAGSFLTMQDDGNLVLRGPARKPLWSSRTSGYPGAVAVLQDDGNVVVSQHGVAYWTSNGLGGLLGDDYPANLHKAPRDSLIDPWRFYNRECTSFVAWRMNSANHVDFNNFMGGGHFGNAGNWDDNARALGYPVNSVPARGAIAESDSQGHVAWVAEVGDGTVTIEDYNFSAPGEYGTRTVPTSTYVYIHINDL
jgi:surface antigen